MDFTTFANIIASKPRSSKATYHGINPATEELLFEAPVATEDDLNDAVVAARQAFSSWSETPFEERCKLVRRYAEAFVTEEEGFVELLMRETGKPVSLFCLLCFCCSLRVMGFKGKGKGKRVEAWLIGLWRRQKDVAEREVRSSYEGMIEASKLSSFLEGRGFDAGLMLD